MPLTSVGGGGIFNGRSRRRASDFGTLHTLDVAGIVVVVVSSGASPSDIGLRRYSLWLVVLFVGRLTFIVAFETEVR